MIIGNSDLCMLSDSPSRVALISASRASLQWNKYRYAEKITVPLLYLRIIHVPAAPVTCTKEPSMKNATHPARASAMGGEAFVLAQVLAVITHWKFALDNLFKATHRSLLKRG